MSIIHPLRVRCVRGTASLKRRKLTDERRQVDLPTISCNEHRGLEVYLFIVRAASGT
jgi:hypothetical protein